LVSTLASKGVCQSIPENKFALLSALRPTRDGRCKSTVLFKTVCLPKKIDKKVFPYLDRLKMTMVVVDLTENDAETMHFLTDQKNTCLLF